jgi:hypothetical protein
MKLITRAVSSNICDVKALLLIVVGRPAETPVVSQSVSLIACSRWLVTANFALQ